MVARGEGAQQLEPNLVELPGRCAAWVGAGAGRRLQASAAGAGACAALLCSPFFARALQL
jgi:hypothetical protein